MKTLTEVITEHEFSRVRCRCGWSPTAVFVRTAREEWAAHVAAAYREARTITVYQLASLPDGTWIRDGRNDVGVKRDWPLDLAVRYGDRGDKINTRIPEPIYVIYLPGEEGS